MTTVHVVLPDTVTDPARPSGGNTYDRRVCSELSGLGWSVRVHLVPGPWPHPGARSEAALAAGLAALPRDAVVLLDGLVASWTPEVVVPEAARLRVVVLVHLPLGHPTSWQSREPERAERERAVLTASAAVLATSEWTRRWLLDHYDLHPDRVHVAAPGVDLAIPATGSESGSELLCVAAVVPAKGHRELLDALATLGDRSWRLVCAGSLDLDPDHVASLRVRCHDAEIADRVTFVGPLTGRDLDDAYAAADVLVHPSRMETYGLVATEALARGLPVIATSVGGIAEALGTAPDGTTPGLLVPPTAASEGAADVGAADGLGRALRCWLEDAGLRERLRTAATARRTTLSPWSTTATQVAAVLTRVAA
ncbi:glycosyltransferase involved in cell wall biosynthesis [Phycicoccus badiiscoriae]|uniref:Glycosyltransferase involved in cell wall biosynthesis n=1 Tax=Pedococcus badiiscoriae TaxID=642776 RepID=A0A852WF88_9MICO|nr:glycosyltransferase involved in cell wall biosynthesis [Pedococcus badiiscoriae]